MNFKTIIKYPETSNDDQTPTVLYALGGCNHFVPSKGGLVCQACGCHQHFHEQVKTEKTQPPVNHVTSTFPSALALPPPPPPASPDPPGSALLLSLFPPLPTTTQDPSTFKSPLAPARPPPQTTFTQDKTQANIASRQNATNRNEIKVQSAGIRRTRTRFTRTQKNQMEAFANKINWGFRGQCREEIDEFCSEIGVTIRAFQIWICNHKSRSKAK